MKLTITQNRETQPLVFSKDQTWGDWLDVKLPEDCECMVICIDTMQHEPERVCLPHQLYRDWLENVFKRTDVRSVTLIPVRVKEKITIERQM